MNGPKYNKITSEILSSPKYDLFTILSTAYNFVSSSSVEVNREGKIISEKKLNFRTRMISILILQYRLTVIELVK